MKILLVLSCILFPVYCGIITEDAVVEANANQQWLFTVTGTDNEGLIVHIKSTRSNKCIDNKYNGDADGNRIEQNTCSNGDPQRWVVVHSGPHFMIKNIRTRKCIGVQNGSYDDEADLSLWSCNGEAEDQHWYYETGRLINKRSRKCIDVPNGANSNNLQLIQWTCT